MARRKQSASRRSGAAMITRELSPYLGPLHLGNQNGLNMRTIRVQLTRYTDVSTDSSGNVGQIFSDSQVTTTSAWPEFKAQYCEYRVIGWKARYVPIAYNNNPVAGLAPPVGAVGAWAGYHENATPGLTVADIVRNSGYKVFHTGRESSVEVRMRGTDELNWKDPNGGIVGRTCITLATDPMPSAVNLRLGRVFIDYIVEFRNRI